MYRALSRPCPDLLSIKVQRDCAKDQARQVKSSNKHQRTNETDLDHPIIEKLGHAVTPNILDHSGSHEKLTSGRFIAIDLEQN